MRTVHIAALFNTASAAYVAREHLVSAGVQENRILVLDRGHAEDEAPPRRGLWDTLRQFFLPDDDATQYADAIVRGHPLLVADIDEPQRQLALDVLTQAGAMSVEAHDETWRTGFAGGLAETGPISIALHDNSEAAGSEGIVAGGIIAGDYGAVGAVPGAVIDTDILRGKRMRV